MYKIIGADGKEYGPVSVEQLLEWVTQGRVSKTTKVKGETDSEWQTLETLPDFAGIMASPPPLLAGTPAATTATPPTSGLAISSLVLGILGLFSCGATAVIGLIFGIISFSKIKKSQGRLSGSGLAIAGIVVSAIFILMLPVFAALLLPALSKAKAKAQTIQCVNNAKQIAMGVIMYANANTNTCPAAASWCDDVLAEVGAEKIFQCSAGNKVGRSHYAYNTSLDCYDISEVKDPTTTVLIFESTGGWNLSGGRELLLQNSRHNRKIVVGFVDGHVEMINESDLSRLDWEP